MSTTLPDINAATVWPIKIATGKFQGLITRDRPFPISLYLFNSPVGPCKIFSLKILLASF